MCWGSQPKFHTGFGEQLTMASNGDGASSHDPAIPLPVTYFRKLTDIRKYALLKILIRYSLQYQKLETPWLFLSRKMQSYRQGIRYASEWMLTLGQGGALGRGWGEDGGGGTCT